MKNPIEANMAPTLYFSDILDPSLIQKLLSTLPELICIIDTKGRFVYVNQHSLSVLGYAPDEMMGRKYSDFLADTPCMENPKMVYKADELFFSSQFTCCFLKKDGTQVPLTWTGHWDPMEQLKYYSVRVSSEIDQDTTKQYNNEGIKNYSDKVFDLMENVQDGFFIVNNRDEITYWNKQAEQIMLRTKEDLLGRYLWDCFPDLLHTSFHKEYRNLKTQHVPRYFETYIATSHVWLEVNFYPSKDGISIFLRNITERKRIEDELHLLSTIVKETVNSVVLMDLEGTITWINSAFTKFTGFTPDEAIGKMVQQILKGLDADPTTFQHIKERLSNKESVQVELVSYKKNGDKYWVSLYCQPLQDKEGNVIRYMAIASDITEQKRLSDRLKLEMESRQKTITNAVIKAQERERSVIGRELHDNVNQVLTTVKLYTEHCLNDGHNAELLTRSVHYLNNCIQEIRSLSKRLSAPTIGNIHLSDSLTELIESITATNKLHIEFDPQELRNLHISKDLHIAVYRIVQEHLTNILKHAEAENVQITIRTTNKNLSVLIADDGKGFDPKEKKSGVGITNMISRAESLHGSLKLISLPGNGCTMLVSFPLM
jgi:PAS domain S-box-containing protein